MRSDEEAAHREALRVGALALEREGLEVAIAGWRADPEVRARLGAAPGPAVRVRDRLGELIGDFCSRPDPWRAAAMVTTAQAFALVVLEAAPGLVTAPEVTGDVAQRVEEWRRDADVKDLRARLGDALAVARAELERLVVDVWRSAAPAGAVAVVTTARLLAVVVLDEDRPSDTGPVAGPPEA